MEVHAFAQPLFASSSLQAEKRFPLRQTRWLTPQPHSNPFTNLRRDVLAMPQPRAGYGSQYHQGL